MLSPETYGSLHAINRELVDSFEADVAALDLKSIAIPLPGKALPAGIDRFSLAPIMPTEKDLDTVRNDPVFAITYDFQLPPGIEPAPGYRSSYLDTGLALGLVFDSKVVGIAGAAAEQAASGTRLVIKQIQGWEFRPQTRDEYRYSGLHGGFLWRHTLANAWAQLAIKHGIDEMTIQGAANNRSAAPTGPSFPRYLARYDKVAQEMGFSLEPESGDFVLRLIDRS